MGYSKLLEVYHYTGYIDATRPSSGRRLFLRQQGTGVGTGRLGLYASDVRQYIEASYLDRSCSLLGTTVADQE